MGLGASWQPSVFDPVFIVAQLFVMQCIFYLAYGAILWLLCAVILSEDVTLELMLRPSTLGSSHLLGIFVCLANTLASLVAACFLPLVVGRAKKVLDFCASLFIWHWWITWGVFGFPSVLSWWILAVLNCVCMTLVGEYLCLKEDMREIPIRSAVPTYSNVPDSIV